MKFLLLWSLFYISVSCIYQSPSIQTLTPETFKQEISKGFSIVAYYAPWCGFCKRFADAYEFIAKKYQKKIQIQFSSFDCHAHRYFCDHDVEVLGYPTINLYHDGKLLEEYVDERTEEKFEKFIKSSMEKYKHLGPLEVKEDFGDFYQYAFWMISLTILGLVFVLILKKREKQRHFKYVKRRSLLPQ